MDTLLPKRLLLLAASIQKHAEDAGLARRDEPSRGGTEMPSSEPLALYDRVVTQPALRNATRKLFADGHYALAVEEAYKCLNNTVKVRAKLPADGAALMRSAFSPQKPILKLSPLRTMSQRDQQQGYMDMMAGCMTGIRNPRAHEHQYADDANVAVEMLTWANHLMRIAITAKRARRIK